MGGENAGRSDAETGRGRGRGRSRRLRRVNARVNNLLDRDFTTYATEFRDLNGDGDYRDLNVDGSGRNEALFFDGYNNKDKARSVWVSLNARF